MQGRSAALVLPGGVANPDHLRMSQDAVRFVRAFFEQGKPIPSDHAPLVMDLDEPGIPFDPGWDDAGARILARGGLYPTRTT